MLNREELRGALLAAGAGLVLLLAILTVTPGFPGDILFQSLRFHFIAVGILLWVALFVFGARWRSLFLLIPLILAGVHSGMILMEIFNRRTPIAAEPVASLDFLSFNVLAHNRTASALVDAVIANPPDVMLIMETPGVEVHLQRLETVLPYRVGCERTVTCDIALMSRLPLANTRINQLPPFDQERLVTAEVTLDGQTVTFVGLHLTKPYFDRLSFTELNFIRHQVSAIEGPVIMAGDFNSAAWTDTVGWLIRALDLVPGPWTPATWPVIAGPVGVPIDNMFTRGNARITTIEAGDSLGSNHRPLRASVAIYPS